MQPSQREVLVTGVGIVLPNCDDREVFWEHVSTGASQLAFERNPALPDERCPMGRIRSFDAARYLGELGEIPERFWARYHRELQLYLASVFLCRQDGGIDLEEVKPDRLGLFDGSSRTCFEFWYDLIQKESTTPLRELYTRRELMLGISGQTVGIAASLLKARGPTYVFSGTCSSGAIAIGHAYREIVSGEIDVAFAGGHDSALVPPVYAMYADANLLSAERTDAAHAVRPYVDHSTNAFGEGAVTLLLESREHAEARGARPIAELAGYGYGNNGYHPTTVDVAGVRPAEVIRRLCERASVPLDDVGVVVGHGNAVNLSDVSEENYMRLAFGPRANAVPLVSTKPIYGHTLGASSVINAVAAALMVERDFVIPTINIDEKRMKRSANHQANVGAAVRCEAGIAMSYGMGGHNAALLFRKARPPAAGTGRD